MPRIDIELNGRGYTLTCEEGQEVRIRQLASFVDRRLQRIAEDSPQGSEAQHLMLTALVIADEFLDFQEVAARSGAGGVSVADQSDGFRRNGEADAFVVEAVEGIARRLEDIAERLERA